MALDISCAYYFEVTSASGADGMAAQETGFPLAFDLALLGSGHGFWSHVRSDGGDVRAAKADGTTQLALHVVEIDTTGKKGLIRFNDTSPTAATTWRIYYGNAGASQPGATTTYGSENAYGGTACLMALPLANGYSEFSAPNGSAITVTDHGTTTNDTTIVKIGKSSRKLVRASNQYFDFGTSSKLKASMAGNNGFTMIGLWYMQTLPGSDRRTLLSRGDQHYNIEILEVGTDLKITGQVYDTTYRQITITQSRTTVFPAGAWYSVALRVAPYISGAAVEHKVWAAKDKSNTYSASGTHVSLADSGQTPELGEQSQNTGRQWNGNLQMWEVYNSDKGDNYFASWTRMMLSNSTFWPTVGAEVAVPTSGVQFAWQRNLKNGAMQAMAGGFQ